MIDELRHVERWTRRTGAIRRAFEVQDHVVVDAWRLVDGSLRRRGSTLALEIAERTCVVYPLCSSLRRSTLDIDTRAYSGTPRHAGSAYADAGCVWRTPMRTCDTRCVIVSSAGRTWKCQDAAVGWMSSVHPSLRCETRFNLCSPCRAASSSSASSVESSIGGRLTGISGR